MIYKKFNTTGPCVSKKHYMVNIDEKMNKIAKMIDEGDYFIINRPRQYGKTTMIYSLDKKLCDKYTVINISFEGIGELILQSEERFSEKILEIMADSIEFTDEESSEKLRNMSKEVKDLSSLSKVITRFTKNSTKEVILFIDEVDKFSNDRLFLSFLGVLRNKFIASNNDKDYTFKSVILVGVHDVKNLKLKLRQGEDIRLNSPWNIAVNFNIDMNFNIKEIESMLCQYSELNDIGMDTNYISSKIFYYTNGYPFLVSRLCQIMDENKYHWVVENIDLSVKQILKEQNTLFDDLIKNIENNKEIYDFIERILVLGEEIPFVISDVIISMCTTYGIIREEQEKCKINNRIFELYLYNHMTSKVARLNDNMENYNFRKNFINEDGSLDFVGILRKFQQFMKEQYSSLDIKFIEREGRLLFLAFIKPIINGIGFDFKEVQISQEKRLDIVITYNNYKYIVELKIWRGEKYHKEGINQLVEYLNIHNIDKGYLLVFDFNKNKEYKEEYIIDSQKEIFSVYV